MTFFHSHLRAIRAKLALKQKNSDYTLEDLLYSV